MALNRVLRALLLLCVLGLGGAAHAQDSAEPAKVAEVAAPALSQDLSADTLLSRTDDAALQSAFRRMKRTADVQWELKTDVPVRRPPSRFWQAVAEFFAALAPLFAVVVYLGLAALAAVVLYAIFTAVRGIVVERRDREDAPDALPEYRPSAEAARVLLEEADALAAQGRFREAVRVILYRSIQDIGRARPDAVRLSLTSREIARSPALGPNTRATFSAIARVVETSHFGGRAATAADYQRARALYTQLAAPAPAPASVPIGAVPA